MCSVRSVPQEKQGCHGTCHVSGPEIPVLKPPVPRPAPPPQTRPAYSALGGVSTTSWLTPPPPPPSRLPLQPTEQYRGACCVPGAWLSKCGMEGKPGFKPTESLRLGRPGLQWKSAMTRVISTEEHVL
ncbi:hypothetical protein J4Q44_G00110420 [Coregonus suidteri]|uniref:Uncharacterized protein n=1 Tax=Coregonus suidteri TaxID=861788 RepID=A0AAN8QZ88_9TELE